MRKIFTTVNKNEKHINRLNEIGDFLEFKKYDG